MRAALYPIPMLRAGLADCEASLLDLVRLSDVLRYRTAGQAERIAQQAHELERALSAAKARELDAALDLAELVQARALVVTALAGGA